ncbi:MAG TPA: ferrochelatase [Thermomicrobiales bacterium]|nr:ferrochelatase [Thermomicrobiales bacterium]
MTIAGAQSRTSPRYDQVARQYDALLLLSFGGPEGPDDVIPFLENVTRGRNVPRERLDEVAGHYLHFGGVSPINEQNRALIVALRDELRRQEILLPIYFGNRNWEPFVTDTIARMRADGVQRALVFVTSAFSSYSGCRQYREDVTRAVDALDVADAITFDKIRGFYNHPGYIETMIELTAERVHRIPPDRRATTEIIFTAHSIPLSMAQGCAYEKQLLTSSSLVAGALELSSWRLAYQSRSGPPAVPWLEPDILDELETLPAAGFTDAVIVPIGFISDHMEVLFDLDHEAAERAEELGLGFQRVPTAGIHPRFVSMIRELIEERMTVDPHRPALGPAGPLHDICPLNCCLIGAGRPASRAASAAHS